MSETELAHFESLITKKLENLTAKGTVTWKQEDHKYTASYNGLIFEIENTGQNLLVINLESNGHNLAIIMDCAGRKNVELLLSEVKNQTASPPQGSFSVPDGLRLYLSRILDALNREA